MRPVADLRSCRSVPQPARRSTALALPRVLRSQAGKTLDDLIEGVRDAPCAGHVGGRTIGRRSPLPGRSGLVVILSAFVTARQGPGLAGRPLGPPAPAAPAWTPWPRSCWTGCRTGGPAAWSGSCKTEVGDSMDLLLGELAALEYCQPDGTLITSLAELGEHLVETARTGEAILVDGLATRVQRPREWGNQKVLY